MYKYSLIIIATCLIAGCCKAPSYANAYQLPALQYPPNSLPVSHRYDIPNIANNDCHIIENIQPPYY